MVADVSRGSPWISRFHLPGSLSQRSRASVFHGAAHSGKTGGLECQQKLRESSYCRSTPAATYRAAASWPTITELTPTMVFPCLFTCYKRTVFTRRLSRRRAFPLGAHVVHDDSREIIEELRRASLESHAVLGEGSALRLELPI